METEMKDKKQLNKIKDYIEEKTNQKVVGIKCQKDYIRPRFIISILLKNRKLLFIESYKEDYVLKAELRKLIKEYNKDIEKQNSLK